MDLPPAAPTPPVNNGGMPSNADRTANLLNLLKFSGNNAHQQKQQQAAQAQSQAKAEAQSSSLSEQQQVDGQVSQRSRQVQGQQNHHQHQRKEETYESAESASSKYDQMQPQLLQGLPQHNYPTLIHQPAPTSADPSGLLAALMRGAHEAEDSPKPTPAPAHTATQAPPFSGEAPSADTTSYLLNLLNRPKPSQTELPLLTETSRPDNITPQSAASQTKETSRLYGHDETYSMAQKYQQAQAQIFAHQQQAHNGSYHKFSGTHGSADDSALYQQLLGNLSQKSPSENTGNQHGMNSQTLRTEHSSSHGSKPYEQGPPQDSPTMSPPHVRHSLDQSSTHQSPISQHSHPSHHSHHSARHLGASHLHDQFDPSAPSGTVAGAVEGLSRQIDDDATQAVARAELMQNSSDYRDVEREGIFERGPDYDSGEPFIGNDEDGRAGEIGEGVVDNWESAGQDEIVVIEEKVTPPIKVFNFPMKPFISINLQDEFAEFRPEFRPESVLDIARLKKEFDQMDRNLYTASLRYMTYGMSKQGGMRVIRQDDGKDAKIFTDTKDRIFNLAISTTPEDSDAIPSEAIIGTGVSGTVYWVLVKDGDKDHIGDNHLEQYGFALPPIPSHEGDAPGGVLKTRARASTAHPEYFAVGRGKSISIVWPSYIMQKKLFKAGHDRVVDTETLQKQCSLRINTGKAGKDFTFSQDDTVVVSLDKSGRVKFWDVRDLTAVKAGSDSRYPMPAESNLEVKEPLMSLASTPEGEKAWPTSVLLLDKQRPYQKQCALRYMIVGMKQNHTLQLWDLALGKPVQEFNLPHSKESDAVCSVMYHPASGMIVIGHPTRNSIYFAHLSAPKYNLKSVSQAEYIQRIVAQDASIPQPDSTAVISGVREYSFGDRGVLRSLDLLPTPAMDQDPDEATLFELYAMHSKGVLCVLVRQAELGWNTDNKVIDGVNAVNEGIITVSKLKTPQPPEPNEIARPPPPPPQKGTKEVAAAETLPIDLVSRGPDGSLVKVKHEVRETDAAAQSAKESQSEKPDRKPRKKKTAAANQTETATNGVNSRSTSKEAPKDAIGGFSNEAVEAALAGVELRLATTVENSVASALNNMQLKLDQSAEAREAIYEENQKQLLGMVSEVLNENVQSVLGSLIHTQFDEMVIPVISTKTNEAVADLLDKFQPQIASSVVKEIQKNLSQSLAWALRNKEVINNIADRVSDLVAAAMQQNLMAALTQQLPPMISNTLSQNTQRFVGELHQSYREQLEQLQAQHVADTNKIDQLMSNVTRLTDMVGTMAQTQSQMQADFLKFKQQQQSIQQLSSGVTGGALHHDVKSQGYGTNTGLKGSALSSNYPGQAPTHAGPYMGSPQYSRGNNQSMTSPQGSAPAEPVAASTVSGMTGSYGQHTQMEDSVVDQDVQQHIRRIEKLIQDGSLQDAMLHWIQSGHEAEIFRRCLSRYPPTKFAKLPLIMLLVVIATISKNLKPNRGLKEEIDWIDMAVKAFGENMMNYGEYDQGQDFNEVVKSTTQTLQLLNNRMQPLLEEVRNGFPTDPFLMTMDRSKMEWIVQSSQHILQSLGRRYEQ